MRTVSSYSLSKTFNLVGLISNWLIFNRRLRNQISHYEVL